MGRAELAYDAARHYCQDDVYAFSALRMGDSLEHKLREAKGCLPYATSVPKAHLLSPEEGLHDRGMPGTASGALRGLREGLLRRAAAAVLHFKGLLRWDVGLRPAGRGCGALKGFVSDFGAGRRGDGREMGDVAFWGQVDGGRRCGMGHAGLYWGALVGVVSLCCIGGMIWAVWRGGQGLRDVDRDQPDRREVGV